MNWQFDIGNFAVGVGTVALAVATVYISHRNLAQLRKQKVAEFRLQWVEDLRKDVASIVALATIKNRSDQQVREMHEVQARIMLRLNRKEIDHLNVKDQIFELIALMRGEKTGNVFEQASKVVMAFQDVFNTEWARIKSEITDSKLNPENKET